MMIRTWLVTAGLILLTATACDSKDDSADKQKAAKEKAAKDKEAQDKAAQDKAADDKEAAKKEEAPPTACEVSCNRKTMVCVALSTDPSAMKARLAANASCKADCKSAGMEDKATKCNKASFTGKGSCSDYLKCMGY